jgi:hypothetical protein
MATTVKTPSSPDYGPEIDSGEMVDVPTTNARQAVTGQNVRNVLRFGVAGVVIAFIVIYAIFFWH